MHLLPGKCSIRGKHETLAFVSAQEVATSRMQHQLCHMQTVSSISFCMSTDACICILPAGSHRLQQRPCSVLVWCHCRVQSPVAIVTAVILLGAGWAVPYYVPLPAYNLRKGGSFSAVLEGIVSLLNFQRLPLNEHPAHLSLSIWWSACFHALICMVNVRQKCCYLVTSDLASAAATAVHGMVSYADAK